MLIPSVGAAAAATELQGAATAANTADEKLGTAIGRLDACRASTTGTVNAASRAKVALRNMMADLALEESARSNLITPSQVDQIDLTRPAELQQACQTLYDHLTA